MSKEQNDPGIQKSEFPAGLSMEKLMEMFLATQKQLADAQNKLADAVLQSRIPYVDPKVLAQKQQALEERRRQIETELRQRQIKKKLCPHVRENGTPNIKWMEHSNKIIKGTCGTCFSEFDTRNPEDAALLRKDLKSIKNMGRAGAHAARGVLVEV